MKRPSNEPVSQLALAEGWGEAGGEPFCIEIRNLNRDMKKLKKDVNKLKEVQIQIFK